MEILGFYPSSCYDSAIVVPCYKEAGRINTGKYLDSLDKFSAQVFLVDDGSPDATFETLKKLAKSAPDRFIAVKSPQNQGKAEAVRLGMNLALDNHFKKVGFLDADLAVSFEEIGEFFKIFKTESDINTVIGVRSKLAGRKIDRTNTKFLIQKIIAKMGNLLFKPKVIDTQCGAKVFDAKILKPAIKKPFSVSWLFDQELLTRISRMKESIGKNWLFEVPVREWIEIGGSHRKLSDYGKCLKEYFTLLAKYGIRK